MSMRQIAAQLPPRHQCECCWAAASVISGITKLVSCSERKERTFNGHLIQRTVFAFVAFGLIFCGMFIWNISMSNISMRQIRQMGPQDGRNSE